MEEKRERSRVQGENGAMENRPQSEPCPLFQCPLLDCSKFLLRKKLARLEGIEHAASCGWKPSARNADKPRRGLPTGQATARSLNPRPTDSKRSQAVYRHIITVYDFNRDVLFKTDSDRLVSLIGTKIGFQRRPGIIPSSSAGLRTPLAPWLRKWVWRLTAGILSGVDFNFV